MQTKVFHGFMCYMLNNLSDVQRCFEENQTFSSDSDLALALERLAGQVNNLRIGLVDGYAKKKA